VANGRGAWNYRHDLKRLRVARYQSYYQSIIKGAIIVAALALDGGLTRLVRAK
jgi:ribose/xylose/arabinose/galactoside ABC-type transport system permease subunit